MNSLTLLSASLSNLRAEFDPVGYAQAVSDVAGSRLSGITAGGSFGTIAQTIAEYAWYFFNFAAVLAIVISGILAVVAQDEGRIASARKVLSMSLIATILINLSAVLTRSYLKAFNYGVSGSGGADPSGAALDVESEIAGVIEFLETPAAVIAIITIISYGIKALIDYNGEQGLQSFKKAVLSVLMGIFLISIKVIIADGVIYNDVTGVIDPVLVVIGTVLGFVMVIGVVVIAIAGIVMVVNIADESRFEKARKVIISVTAGLVLMAVVSGLIGVIATGANIPL